MSLRRIGILGGMGREATLLLMRKLLAAVPAEDDADHIPLIVDMNPQVPSRISRLIHGTGDNPGPVLAAMARRLEVAGAEALAMPCNTAHHYAPEIRAAVNVSFIDMVDLSVARAAAALPEGGGVGLIASPAVQHIGLFDRALAGVGLSAVYPVDTDAMLGHPADQVERPRRGGARGASFQLVACTDSSLLKDVAADGVILLDTLDVLVEAIAGFACTQDAGHGRAT